MRFPGAALDDLRARLRGARWPAAGEGEAAEGSKGIPQSVLRPLVEHWVDGFDWRAQEARLNAFPNHRAAVGGHDVHFIHEPGGGPALLLLNGWPSSVFEHLPLIPKLSALGYSVVAPSLPGFTLSFTPGETPSVTGVAEAMAALMTALGYAEFGVVGGDTGASVMSRLAQVHPERLSGILYTFVNVGLGPEALEGLGASGEAYAAELAAWNREETGYFAIQGTRPRTLAYGLTDSPVGLAAWIIEKMLGWSDRTGAAENPFTDDDLLANVTLYWLTGCIGASMWPYWARLHGGWSVQEVLRSGARLRPPAAVTVWPRDYPRAPRALAERFLDLRRYREMSAGGHFPAFEAPSALAGEVDGFFKEVTA